MPLLEMRGIVKTFFGVRVLDEVSLTLERGEVLALLGENGAGKSTLIKILNGDYSKDSGDIFIDGERVQFHSPRDAEDRGIRMIYQELHFAPDLSVAENLLLGRLPKRGWRVDWRAMEQIAGDHLRLLQVDVDPRTPMRALSVVEREIVEITKALVGQARIVVMDEPTAALTPQEVDLLFGIIRTLRAQGIGIIYISHRLDEVFEIADRITVLRDGKHVGTHPVKDVTPRELVKMMVGREIEQGRRASGGDQRRPVLEVRHLAKAGAFMDVNLTVHAGEIVGIFGLLGAGHARLTRALFGAERIDAGEVRIDGVPVTIHSPRDAKRAGVGFVPIDRKGQSLVLEMNVRENTTLSNWGGVSRAGVFMGREERRRVRGWVDRLGIRMAGGIETKIRYLSGGNQQKVVLARWLEANVKLLLLNEPTWGVDVGARADIYDQLETLAAGGLALLVVSSDIQEVLAISHRIITMHKGRITGEFRAADADQSTLLSAAAAQPEGAA